MATQAILAPTYVDLTVTRKADNPLRVTIYENGEPADLTGDTLLFLVKDDPGGVTKISKNMTLDVQAGATKGQATVTLTKAELVGGGAPNDSPVDPLVWVYQVRRSHGGQETVELAGDLTLAPTI